MVGYIAMVTWWRWSTHTVYRRL